MAPGTGYGRTTFKLLKLGSYGSQIGVKLNPASYNGGGGSKSYRKTLDIEPPVCPPDLD